MTDFAVHFRNVALLFGVVATTLAVRAQPTCQPLSQKADDRHAQEQELLQPGAYCAREDLSVKGHLTVVEGWSIVSVSKRIVSIDASDVSLDLQGHAATSDSHLTAGIDTLRVKAHKPVPWETLPKNIKVSNGALKLDRSGIGIRFSGMAGMVADAQPNSLVSDLHPLNSSIKLDDVDHSIFQNLWPPFALTASSYPVRNLTVERMQIRTHEAAIVLQGANSIIRDNIIEVDDGTAIWLYGPGAVIENNTIIVRGDGERILEADGVIRLHHGDGAVIRNNKIVVKGRAPKRAVSVFDTGAFTMQDNRIFGVDQADGVKAFTGTLQMQAEGNTFASIWQFDRQR